MLPASVRIKSTRAVDGVVNMDIGADSLIVVYPIVVPLPPATRLPFEM